MFNKCPACGSLDVRRSSTRSATPPVRRRFRVPYRCRECGERFWVISRRTYFVGGIVALAVLGGVLAWNVGSAPEDHRRADAARNVPAPGVLEETLKLAAKNDPVAEYRLSHLYAKGSPYENKKEARKWLERAAEHGNPEAQYELGNALREGIDSVQDYERAAKWLQLAAEAGNADAQYALGLMFHAGMGVPVDNAKAYTWFNLAAAQGVAGALVQRDATLRLLAPDQVLEAQAESRRLSENSVKRTDQQRD